LFEEGRKEHTDQKQHGNAKLQKKDRVPIGGKGTIGVSEEQRPGVFSREPSIKGEGRKTND